MTREQGLIFGEVADDYDALRPGYPDALFDHVMQFGALEPGARAVEIGAGTGKATRSFLARGLSIHALEPSPEMAAVLQQHGSTRRRFASNASRRASRSVCSTPPLAHRC